MIFYAHSVDGQPEAVWEELLVHATEAQRETAVRAAKFGCASLGETLGLLHDFGKFKLAFQRYLRDPKVTGKGHSTAGAVYALRHFGVLGQVLAHVIAGHHAGLKDHLLAREGRLVTGAGELDLALAGLAAASNPLALPPTPAPPQAFVPDGAGATGFQFCFLIRMLLSCLVDADRFCTARFYARFDSRVIEVGSNATIRDLAQRLTAWMDEAASKRAAAGTSSRDINRRRTEILASVRGRVGDPPGVFTLTVPTGGGKTLTALEFALRHAAEHGFDRVIAVIPFTSVIEQSAAVYRDALGDLASEVLEHHTAFDEEKLRGEDRQGYDQLHLAMENWDARIVVTTAMQFFESLFSNRPSQCRKLHNIARSVIIIDEAQTMPLTLLRPCVAALRELLRNYKTSIVLSTATQPALLDRPDDPDRSFKGGFPAAEVVELAPDPPALFQAMKRVTLAPIGEQDDEALAARLNGADQALCVVNTRRHARELYGMVTEMAGGERPTRRHLSTMMHAAHRSRVLADIRADLKAGRRCRVVSTSLIEAGVDVDFPLAMRAEAGLDQVAQCAGRLNRESRRSAAESLLLLFKAKSRFVPANLATNIEAGLQTLDAFGDRALDPDAIESYFQTLYRKLGKSELDRHGILNQIHDTGPTLDFPFETIAQDFRLIESSMRPVIVANDEESRQWLAELEDRRSKETLRTIARKLQRYTVGLTTTDFGNLVKARVVEAVRPDQFADQFVKLVHMDLYRDDVGLDCSDPYFATPGSMIIGP